jgi:5-methyltetrahydropteroyltriglutamate--homocysteine methyltransferase
VAFKTTHTGSLPRPEDLLALMFAREGGEKVANEALDRAIEQATSHVVERQKQAGVTVINDGEMSKPSYATYIKHRLSGFGGEAGQYEFQDLPAPRRWCSATRAAPAAPPPPAPRRSR